MILRDSQASTVGMCGTVATSEQEQEQECGDGGVFSMETLEGCLVWMLSVRDWKSQRVLRVERVLSEVSERRPGWRRDSQWIMTNAVLQMKTEGIH